MVRCSGRNHHKRAGTCLVLLPGHPHPCLSLDDIDDLVALVCLFGSGVLAGTHGSVCIVWGLPLAGKRNPRPPWKAVLGLI